MNLLSVLLSLACICAPIAAGQNTDTVEASTPLNALSFTRIEALDLSPDGTKVAFVTSEPDLEHDTFRKILWTVSANSKGVPVRLTDSGNDESPKWSPNGRDLAFLSTRHGISQIWSISARGGLFHKVTNISGGVVSFQWAPNGQQIAFLCPAPKAPYELHQDDKGGVVVNKWDFSIYKLLRSKPFLDLDRGNQLWIVDLKSKQLRPILTKGDVTDFAWSPDSQKIATTVQVLPGLNSRRTDVIIYSIPQDESRVVLNGSGGQYFDNTSSYSNPVWSPDGENILFLNLHLESRWQATPRIGLYRLSDSTFTLLPAGDHLSLYNPQLSWTHDNGIVLENTVNGSRHLFFLPSVEGEAVLLTSNRGSQSHHSFSRDGKCVAFIQESTEEPPEIHLSVLPFTTSKPLTTLGRRMAKGITPIEQVQWQSTDGTMVQGWLVKPEGFRATDKYPLIVLLHGGPGLVVSNEFDMYQEWPYPYRGFARRGYVVLMPNYRGSGSYRPPYSAPRDISDEPVEDIVSGVEWVKAQGFIDSDRIGIAGHSHGAWLGPQVMTTHPLLFRAASFAEGSVDKFSNYGEMSGWLNINVQDYYYLGTPYENAERYWRISPLFHVAGLRTATLLESGDQSLAVQGFEFQTALWRCGVPSEFVIYPKTGHTMDRPLQEAASADRNLDWFDYWLLGRKQPDPHKREQYLRWERTDSTMRIMRGEHPCSPTPEPADNQ